MTEELKVDRTRNKGETDGKIGKLKVDGMRDGGGTDTRFRKLREKLTE